MKTDEVELTITVPRTVELAVGMRDCEKMKSLVGQARGQTAVK